MSDVTVIVPKQEDPLVYRETTLAILRFRYVHPMSVMYQMTKETEGHQKRHITITTADEAIVFTKYLERHGITNWSILSS